MALPLVGVCNKLHFQILKQFMTQYVVDSQQIRHSITKASNVIPSTRDRGVINAYTMKAVKPGTRNSGTLLLLQMDECNIPPPPLQSCCFQSFSFEIQSQGGFLNALFHICVANCDKRTFVEQFCFYFLNGLLFGVIF